MDKQFDMLGENAKVSVVHKLGTNSADGSFVYGLNTGFIMRGGEKIRAYVFGIKTPLNAFVGRIIAVITNDDTGDISIVAAPKGRRAYMHEIKEAVDFCEDISKISVICLWEKSCGAVVYKRENNRILYLLIRTVNGNYGFPKGHVEAYENERQTAMREVLEETGVHARIVSGFRNKIRFRASFFSKKDVVYFLARFGGEEVRVQESEVDGYKLVPFEQAVMLLTHKDDRNIIALAQSEIRKIETGLE